jgi:putative toxin-antitoxin system antitoxin component (TIGR02293 family)
VKDLEDHFELSAKELAGVLDITPRTFSRWKGKPDAMSEQQADRMLILAGIFELGREVLGSEEEVKKWIREPIFALDGRIPLDLLKTESGRRKVESALHQIEHGSFAALRRTYHFTSCEAVVGDSLEAIPATFYRPDWVFNRKASQKYGADWLRSKRTLFLAVRSAPLPTETNYLINPAHPGFASIEFADPASIPLDIRIK